MVIKGKSGFATATVFLILIIITASLAAILKRENFYFTSLSSVIGHRYQLEFKRGIEEKILNAQSTHQPKEMEKEFNVVNLPSQGLFNLSQIVNGQGSQNFYYDSNLLSPAANLIKGCSNGSASLEEIKKILPSLMTKQKSIPIIALQPYTTIKSETLLDLSRCIRISPKISKTNLTLSSPRVLSFIFNIDVPKAIDVSSQIRKNKIKNFNELVSFFKQNNYNYNKSLKWYDFNFGIQQTSRSVALEKNGDIFFMADLFVVKNEKEIISWSDLQWLPGR
jgi:hypothetical protein